MKRKAEGDLVLTEPNKRGKLRTASNPTKSVDDIQTTFASKQSSQKTIKARQKQLEGLKLITKWQSTAEFVPFLEIFPKEIWAIILSNLEDPMDLWNMWKVNPMFRNLSENSRTAEVLFPQIVSLLPSYHNHLNGHRTTCNCSDCNDIPMLDYNCKLRKVCKSLRDAVDKSFEDKLMSNLHHDLEASIPSIAIRLPLDRYYLNRFLLDFCEGPEETRAKRCFHRSFELHILKHQVVEMSKEFFDEFSEELLQLVESIGDQIWRFKIKFSNIDWIEESRKFRDGEYWCFQLYELICQCSSFMTNLKWIEFDLYDLHFLRHTITLKSFFRNHPFPHLEQLEKVRFVPCKDDVFLGFEILASVLHNNPRVKILSVKTCHYTDDTFKFYRRFFEYMESIPSNLVSLNLDSCSRDVLCFHRRVFASVALLHPLIHLNWPLKVLKLSGIDASPKRTLASLFHLLNNFPCLEKLSLSIIELSVGSDIPFLKLPQLTHFQFVISKDSVDYSSAFNVGFFYSLHFLLHSKKLRSLIYANGNLASPWKIRRFMQNHECHEKMLNFRGGRRDLTYSNIWDVFPELEYVRTENECEERIIKTRALDFKRHQCVTYIREYRNGALETFTKKKYYLVYKMKKDGSGWQSYIPGLHDEE